ncbi:hypothetical protein L471_04520 [Klebsiella pneumoniae BIDMC 34]|nr:hypothetical protein P816_03600 [Klebsiella pneumoniae BIDMC 45]EWE38513.1 hypothetical protein L471_04520 [Klebsiella pneumoniae BIDMC 34]
MSKSEKSITQELLRTLLEYDPQTGIFRWKIKASSSAHPGDIAGCIDGQGYRVIRIYGKNRKAHRLAWLYVYGDEPEVIDHIDRNRSNNAIENLRAVTFSQNSANRAAKEGANKQVISSQADSLIKISRIWADFFPANTSNQPI